MSSCLRILLGSALLLAFASASPALTITLNATDSGWFDDSGAHTAANQNYAVGYDGQIPGELRNFFVFDVSGLPAGETILSAKLRVHNPEAGVPTAAWTDGYDSPDATEDYELHEVLLLAAAPPANQVGNTLVFSDLGDGAIFGTHTATAADNGVVVEIGLNAAGIAALDAAVANFVLGGLLTSLTASGLNYEIFFGNTDPPGEGPGTRQLVIEMTPEPGTGLLLGLGLIAITSARRSRATARRNG